MTQYYKNVFVGYPKRLSRNFHHVIKHLNVLGQFPANPSDILTNQANNPKKLYSTGNIYICSGRASQLLTSCGPKMSALDIATPAAKLQTTPATSYAVLLYSKKKKENERHFQVNTKKKKTLIKEWSRLFCQTLLLKKGTRAKQKTTPTLKITKSTDYL